MNDSKEKREYVRRITNAMNRLDRAYLDNEKFVGAQGKLLFLLYAIEDGLPHTQKSICDEWMIPRTTLNSVVKKCEREGYVTLKHVAGTRRELEICLTDAGIEFANKTLENRKRKSEDKQESTGVGLQSIRNMMKKMNGSCDIVSEKERFAIRILFPVAEEC